MLLAAAKLNQKLTESAESRCHFFIRPLKAAYSVTFDLLILKIMFLLFKNTVKVLKFR